MRKSGPRGPVSLPTSGFPHHVLCQYKNNPRKIQSSVRMQEYKYSNGKNSSKSRDAINSRESSNVAEGSNSRDGATSTQTFKIV
jgi:hypothetical protein